jgi:hypothetical protein
LDNLDSEFALLATSVERTARVQQGEVRDFIQAAPRFGGAIGSADAQEPGESGAKLEAAAHTGQPPRGEVLARHLSAAYDALLAHVDQQRAEYDTLPDEVAKSGAVIEMRQLVAGARSLHRSLGWLDAASDPPLDLGTRYLVDHIAAQLVAAESEVTVVAGERSYGKVTNPLSPVFSLSGAGPPADELALVIYVPRREQHSGLLHPLIIHELGHAAEDRHNLVDKVMPGSQRFKASLRTAAKARAKVTGASLSTTEQNLRIRLASWTEEAICDAFATHLLGPTYLYSFMAIVGTSDLDHPGEDHPPVRQRIRLILAHLDKLGWAPQMKAASREIDKWFRQTAQVAHSYVDAEEKYCVNALAQLASRVRVIVASHVGELAFRANGFSSVKGEIFELLRAGIPPSQTRRRRRIDRASIILGSWLFALQKEGANLAALASAASVPELSQLLPKALQDAALLEAWEESA